MSSQPKEKNEYTNNTTERKNSAGENRGKFNTSSGVVNAIQTVGDAVQPFVPLFSMSMNEVKSNLKVVMNEVAALASSMENLNLQASRSAGRATTVRTPLNEAYKAPMVDPNQLNDPFASDDNVRGSRKTVVKKLFRGLEVACKKVPNIENNDTAQSQKGQTELIILLKLGTLCPNITDSHEAKLSNFELSRTVQGLSAEVKNLLDIVRCVTAIQEHVMNKKRETLKIALCPSEIPNELAKIIKKAWQDEPSARPSDLEVQLKLKELYERFQETSPQIRPKDPYCDIEIPYVELTESKIEMPSALKNQPKAIALLEQINAEKMKKS
ncbi:14961_t:CDS:2 [Dentiscutata erythropus]|uniref:14961_t:CDS:1 n=1 Tax=Dentiscutata erythropus TaxID=1348616 RepID=A0A9N8Z827_9GLOM|nr:14961_t:CDS:2 [Dentiscutata erythropus]